METVSSLRAISTISNEHAYWENGAYENLWLNLFSKLFVCIK